VHCSHPLSSRPEFIHLSQQVGCSTWQIRAVDKENLWLDQTPLPSPLLKRKLRTVGIT
jgi:hypothetical protein